MTIEGALAAQTAARRLLRDRTTTMVLAAWQGLPTYDEDQVDAFVARILPAIEAGQRTTALTTTQYLAQVISEQLGETYPLTGAVDVENLRGVDPAEVYRRPFVQTWTALSKGVSFDAAVAVGADRLLRLVDDDLSLAHRRAPLRLVGDDDRISGYRRVIRPELAAGGTCGLCIAASDRVYSRSSLLPIHTRCGCEVMPIVRGRRGVSDPARDLNGADYASIPATRRADLSRYRYSIHEHGELGPQLRREGDNFDGPAVAA